MEHQLRLCRVSITNTSPKWETLTKDNKAADSGPRFCRERQEARVARPEDARLRGGKWDIWSPIANPDGTLTGKPFNVDREVRSLGERVRLE